MKLLCGLCLGIMICAACPYIHGHVRAGEKAAVVSARAWLAK